MALPSAMPQLRTDRWQPHKLTISSSSSTLYLSRLFSSVTLRICLCSLPSSFGGASSARWPSATANRSTVHSYQVHACHMKGSARKKRVTHGTLKFPLDKTTNSLHKTTNSLHKSTDRLSHHLTTGMSCQTVHSIQGMERYSQTVAARPQHAICIQSLSVEGTQASPACTAQAHTNRTSWSIARLRTPSLARPASEPPALPPVSGRLTSRWSHRGWICSEETSFSVSEASWMRKVDLRNTGMLAGC